MLDSLRKIDFASRDVRRAVKKIEEEHRQDMAEHGEAATPLEQKVAGHCGSSSLQETRLAVLNLLMGSGGGVSLDTTSNDDYPLPEANKVKALVCSPEEMAMFEEMRERLGDAIKTLPPRYQTVVQKYYFDGETMRQSGEAIGVNESRASQILKSSRNKLKEALNGSGKSLMSQIGR